MYIENHKFARYACQDEDKLTEEQKKTAKHAETLFKFMFYDKASDTSVVKYIF